MILRSLRCLAVLLNCLLWIACGGLEVADVTAPGDLAGDSALLADQGPCEDAVSALPREDGGQFDLACPETLTVADALEPPPDVEVAVDVGEPFETIPEPPSDCPGIAGAVVSGRLYRDKDETSVSIHSQGYYPKYDEPIGDWQVSLLAQGKELSTDSCSDGYFGFGEVGVGSYVLEVAAPEGAECTSSNRPVRFPQAVREGHVTIVTIGDSVPKVGPSPLFPARLAKLVEGVATVDNLNLAVSGTLTKHWQPGGNLFENVLAPALPDADVVVISIGGNDVMAYIGGSMGNTYQMLQKVEGLDEYTTQLHDAVANIINEIHARAPHADVVFCLYVNYAKAAYWSNQVGPYKDLFAAAGHNALVKARGLLAGMDRVLIADMFGALGSGSVDPYLIDAVHLSAKGHALYAEQLFMVLGGLAIDQDHEPVERLYGFSW